MNAVKTAKSPALALQTPDGARWNRTIHTKEGTGSDDQGTAGRRVHVVGRGDGCPRRLRQDRERREEVTAPAVEAPIVPIRILEAAFKGLLTEFGVAPGFTGEETAENAPALLALVAAVYGATTMQMPQGAWETFSLYRQRIAPQSPVNDEWLLGMAS